MEQPRISIIVPVYNVESYLAQCIDSLIGQTYPALEILLVDDGSTDRSGEICDAYARRDDRIVVIHKENGGNTSARKAGLRAATGAYVQFVDSDDWVEPDLCASLMALAQEHGADLVRCGYFLDTEKTSKRQRDAMPTGVYRTDEERRFLRENLIFLKNTDRASLLGVLWIQLTERRLIEKILFDEPDEVQYAEDRACVFLSLLQADCVCFTGGYLYHYRQREGSIQHQANPRFYAQLNAWYLFLHEQFGACADADRLREQLLQYMDQLVLAGMNHRFVTDRPIAVPTFYFQMGQIPLGARVVLYGAGDVGQSYHKLIQLTNCFQVAAWVDRSYGAYRALGYAVQPVEALQNCAYDCVVVAVLQEKLASSIRNDLVERYGVKPEKVLWLPPVRTSREEKQGKE